MVSVVPVGRGPPVLHENIRSELKRIHAHIHVCRCTCMLHTRTHVHWTLLLDGGSFECGGGHRRSLSQGGRCGYAAWEDTSGSRAETETPRKGPWKQPRQERTRLSRGRGLGRGEGGAEGSELSRHGQTGPGTHADGRSPPLRPASVEPPDTLLGPSPGFSSGAPQVLP